MKHYILGDLIDEISERENNPSTSGYERFVGLEHYVSGDLEIKKYGTTENLNSAMKVFKSGDILVARRNVYLKRASVVYFDGLTSGDSIVLRAKDETMARILPFILNTSEFWEYADQYSDGTMSKRLSPKTLKAYEFDLPDDEELPALADLLWSMVDTKTAYEELLIKTDELVKSQFIEMFGDPIKNDKNWEQVKLMDLGLLARGVSKHRPRNAVELLGGPYPLVQTGEVTNADTYITSYSSTYSELGLKQSKMWPKGTLCITIAANIAQTSILTFEACFPDSVVGFVAGERVETVFVHYWFSFLQSMLEARATQVAQKNLNLKTLGDVEVIVPPVQLQREFVNFTEQSDKSKFELQKSIEKINVLIKSVLYQAINE